MKNKQLNIYADEFAFNFIEDSLQKAGFIVFSAELANEKCLKHTKIDFSQGVKKFYLAKENINIHYFTLKDGEKQVFIPDENKSEIITMLVTGEKKKRDAHRFVRLRKLSSGRKIGNEISRIYRRK